MSIAITPEHVERKTQIAHIGSLPIFEVKTTGGLYVNLLGKNGVFEIVGTGSHRAISRYIMGKKLGFDKIVYDELSKSDWVPYELIDTTLLEKYEQVTDVLASRGPIRVQGE